MRVGGPQAPLAATTDGGSKERGETADAARLPQKYGAAGLMHDAPAWRGKPTARGVRRTRKLRGERETQTENIVKNPPAAPRQKERAFRLRTPA